MKPNGYCLKGPDGKLDLRFVSKHEHLVLCALADSNDCEPHDVRRLGYTVVPVRVVEVKE